jgi:hypothetical protein
MDSRPVFRSMWCRKDRSMWEKLIKWLVFSVLLSLVPLLANYGLHRINKHAIDLTLLLSHGELFLIASALTGTALGEVVVAGRSRKHERWRLCSAGGNLLIVILASMFFAFVCGTQLTTGNMDTSFVCSTSLVVYCFGFFTSACSVILSEV